MTTMLRFTVLLACCVAYSIVIFSVFKMETSPKPTHESAEHDMFKFIYEQHVHKMVLVNGHNCYVFNLSDDERVAVHTDAGIRAIELKILSSLATATLTTMTKDQVDHRIAIACGQHITAYHVQT